jgi:transposase
VYLERCVYRWKTILPAVQYLQSVHTFLEYLKELQSKFHKVILFLDRVPQHCRSIKVRKYLEKNKDDIRIGWFPKGSPEFNAVEECWRQEKDDLLVSKYYPRFLHLRNAITK